MKPRSMVCAPPGHLLISCDLSQAESWIVAFEADEPNMKAALVSDIGIHVTTTRAIFNNPVITKASHPIEVYTGKQTNHATAYKMKPPMFASQYNKNSPNNVISVYQAKVYQTAWHGLYPRIVPWWEEVAHNLRRFNGILKNAYNRRRQFIGPQTEKMQREAVAFGPQSTIADHFRGRLQRHNEIPGGLIEFNRRIQRFGHEVKIVQQGHDSALILSKKEIALDIAQEFKSCLHRPIIIKGEECLVPVDGEIGERWGELEKIKWAA